ncbi:Hypothetical protein PHPALM_6222 [Phytophthora palmivora]|uniref:Uncharacterized protein n=1 Tax=Phytophthora palmivora TaxID=4796 RepID=A0A2P4YFF1_9STRA|nr:Hypothetical protein PHPALM_6222 [Phytophthora palmivora]
MLKQKVGVSVVSSRTMLTSVALLKCFAHDMNNLVKSVLRIRTFRTVTKQAEAVVNYLNASSAKWLPRAQEMMMQTYGKHWKFSTLAPTRWNSMQGCFASLLRVKTAMQMFAVKYRDDVDFNCTMSVLGDGEFWSSFKEAEQAVHPICFASFNLQSDENTLADVVIVFRDLYDKFHRSMYCNDL